MLHRQHVDEERRRLKLSEGASLSELLDKLTGIYGEAFRREVFEPGLKDVKTGFIVTVNEVLMGQLRGVDTKSSEDDNVILMMFTVSIEP